MLSLFSICKFKSQGVGGGDSSVLVGPTPSLTIAFVCDIIDIMCESQDK